VLIVLGIIGVLCAILFPIIGGVRQRARQATCSGNLHQIGTALQMYLNDYNQVYPATVHPLDNSQCGWAELLMPYLRSDSIFECPAALPQDAEFRRGCPPAEIDEDTMRVTDYRGSYGLNFLEATGVRAIRMTRVREPVRTIFVVDGAGTHITPGVIDLKKGTKEEFTPEDMEMIGIAVPERHPCGNNTLFADGHIKCLKIPQLSFRDMWMVY
jgi:prepilin-type processing-associated H-X9-DG protein